MSNIEKLNKTNDDIENIESVLKQKYIINKQESVKINKLMTSTTNYYFAILKNLENFMDINNI